MKYGALSKIIRRWVPAAVIVIILLPLQGYLYAPEAGAAEAAIKPGADYIVCYREDSVDEHEPDPSEGGAPFDVVDGRELRRLLQEDSLEWYEEDGEAILFEEDEDLPAENISWNLAMIGADDESLGKYRGQGVRVGVVDSGVSPHPDLSDNLLPGYNYIGSVKDPENTTDQYGHGTKVAGLLAACGADSRIGAAPEALIVPLKCTDGKTVKISAICRAIYGGIDDFGCEVLNLSLGVKADYQSLREAVAYAAEKDVVVVSAVGNGGTVTEYYPAAYKTVIGVGSVDRSESWYERSNYNSSVFVTAPGVDVLTTSHYGGYEESTGCSFAVPQASAAAAVMRSIDHSLTAEKVMQVLSETARDKGSAGYDKFYGYGIVNIGACVAALAGSGDDPAEPCDGGPDCTLRAFSDLDSSAWYHESIHYVLDRKLMQGYGGALFGPDEKMSRAMVVVMLWRIDGEPQAEEEIHFQDTESGRWYTEAVSWAVRNGIAEGLSSEIFAPDQPVTREQFMTFLCRYAAFKGEDTGAGAETDLSRFTDADSISGWADSAFRWAVGSGIIQGIDETTLSPKTEGTRAQAAAVFMRFGLREPSDNQLH